MAGGMLISFTEHHQRRKAKLKILVAVNEKSLAVCYWISKLPLTGFIFCLHAQYQTSASHRQREGVSGGERNAKTVCREELFLLWPG